MRCIDSVDRPCTLYYTIFTERYPHGIFAAGGRGGGALPTQEKKSVKSEKMSGAGFLE